MDDSGVPLFQDFRKPPCLLGRKKLPYQARSAPIHRCLLAPGCSLSKRLNNLSEERNHTFDPFEVPLGSHSNHGKKIRVIRFVFPSALQGQWKIPNPLRSWRWPSFCHQVTWRSSRIPAGSQNLKSTSLHRTCTFFLNVFESSHFGFQSLLSPDLDHSATPHSSLGA